MVKNQSSRWQRSLYWSMEVNLPHLHSVHKTCCNQQILLLTFTQQCIKIIELLALKFKQKIAHTCHDHITSPPLRIPKQAAAKLQDISINIENKHFVWTSSPRARWWWCCTPQLLAKIPPPPCSFKNHLSLFLPVMWSHMLGWEDHLAPPVYSKIHQPKTTLPLHTPGFFHFMEGVHHFMSEMCCLW